MSIPHSKILNRSAKTINVSKGVMALAKVKRDSNISDNTQNVNVTINNSSKEVEEQKIVKKDNVYFVEDEVNSRDCAEEISQIASDREYDIAINKALSLIIELLESNPLIVNKFIVPHENTFIDLIQSLTLADSVEIKYNDVIDIDCGCFTSTDVSYSYVDKIYVIKSDETASLLYNYPDVIQLLDSHKISYQWIVRNSE